MLKTPGHSARWMFRSESCLMFASEMGLMNRERRPLTGRPCETVTRHAGFRKFTSAELDHIDSQTRQSHDWLNQKPRPCHPKHATRPSKDSRKTKQNQTESRFNPRRPKHLFSGEKLIKFGVEAYLGPNTAAFIIAVGEKVYFLLEVKERKHWALRPQEPLRLNRDGEVRELGIFYI